MGQTGTDGRSDGHADRTNAQGQTPRDRHAHTYTDAHGVRDTRTDIHGQHRPAMFVEGNKSGTEGVT